MTGGRVAGLSLPYILLTSLRHVNWPEGKISPRRIQIEPLGNFLSSAYALELTVPHKTVAEPH